MYPLLNLPAKLLSWLTPQLESLPVWFLSLDTAPGVWVGILSPVSPRLMVFFLPHFHPCVVYLPAMDANSGLIEEGEIPCPFKS